MMGIVHSLLRQTACQQMLALPKEQNQVLEDLMRQLRHQAQRKAASAERKGDAAMVDFWRLVAVFSKHVATAFKRENLKREKAQATHELLAAISPEPSSAPTDYFRYENAAAFRLPEVAERNCLLQSNGLAFSPWIDAGDYVQVDFTVRFLTVDSLYLVAIDGKTLAIRGFHKSGPAWYVHESGEDMPRRVFVQGDRIPEGYEIVGRITDVFKKNAFSGGCNG